MIKVLEDKCCSILISTSSLKLVVSKYLLSLLGGKTYGSINFETFLVSNTKKLQSPRLGILST
jgi:hypothetical protein